MVKCLMTSSEKMEMNLNDFFVSLNVAAGSFLFMLMEEFF